MSVAVITGAAGLVGSEAAQWFHSQGFDVIGIDNDLRASFFGSEASTAPKRRMLERELRRYRHHLVDIRDYESLSTIFQRIGQDIAVVIHAAAQPSHDWAARSPHVDFAVNALGTLNVLECTRAWCPDAVFVFTSTNKVYGTAPNRLPLVERPTRWEIERDHRYFAGISEDMSIDQTMHSLFGASKVAADILVQEYASTFGLKTVCFRCGCLTGPAHAGAELHGFLSYLVRCTMTRRPYRVIGYGGKQVRDNLHSHDLIQAFWQVFLEPRGGEVYNMGGSRHSECSVLEAIALSEEVCGRPLQRTYVDTPRAGDHIWYISDTRRFQSHYPNWRCRYGLREIVEQIQQNFADDATVWPG